jgi:outer membrane immunogenic protein
MTSVFARDFHSHCLRRKRDIFTHGACMKKRLFLGLLAVGVSALTSAMAADVPVAYKAAPPAAPIFTWTGCYVGGNGGGGRAHDDWQSFAGVATLGPVRNTGWSGGVQGGCDYQASSVVFGVEGQFDWADMHGTALIPIVGVGGGFILSSKLDRFATATGRVGYAFDRVLVYAKGGAAWTHFDQQFTQTDFAVPPTTTTLAGGQNVTGFVVGGGFEFALLRNVSFKAEYNYFDFGTNGVPIACVTCAAPTSLTFDIHQKMQTFMIGLNWRFGNEMGPLLAKF